MSEITQEIKDKLEKLCICRGITTATVKQAIRTGKTTLDQVIEETGATQGGCKGSRCKEKISKLIEAYNEGEWQ